MRAVIRRRPRTAAGLLVALIALSGAVGLALISTAPPAASGLANDAPAFTVRGGWTLAELERHIEAGDVDAITAAPAAPSSPGRPAARPDPRPARSSRSTSTVGAPDAVAALTSLGYGNLLTTEAIGVARRCRGRDHGGTPSPS